MKSNPLSELSKNYAELVTLAYTTKINIFDENRDNPKVKLFYVDILIPVMYISVHRRCTKITIDRDR